MNSLESLLDIVLLLVVVALLAALVIWRRGAALARSQLQALQSRVPVKGDSLQIARVAQSRRTAGEASILGASLRESRLYADLAGLVLRSGTGRSPEYFIGIGILAALGSTLLVWAASSILLAGLATGIIASAAPVLWLRKQETIRTVRFEEQLPDALELMAGALRAGHGLPVAFQLVAEEMSAPIAQEFQIVNEQVKFGASFQEALSQMPDRVDSADLSFLIIGLLIQRETGGNLSELFRNLAGIGRERLQLKGKVRVLSSEGRFSGVLLGVLPFALAIILTLLNPDYMRPLWSSDGGHRLIVIGLGMMAIGFVWMSRITKIRV